MNSPNQSAAQVPPVMQGGAVARLTPGAVLAADFPRASLGRRGLDEDHVRAFLKHVEMELVQILNEKAGLSDEVARLRRHVAAGSAGGLPPEDAHVQAVRILAKAQQTADTYVADAERYGREIAVEARKHREEILADARSRAEALLEEAHSRAALAADSAVRSIGPPAGPSEAGPWRSEFKEMEREVAYLRTYGDVYRSHLRSYLEALLRGIEEWERADHGPPDNGGPAQPPPNAR